MNLLMVATGCLFCILVSLTGIHGQAYHFSKGWFPGKRSPYPHMSPLTAPHMDSSYRYPNNAHFIGQRSQSGPRRNDNPERCSISASVRWKIQKLIQMELDRIERECEITKRRMERRFPLDTYQAAKKQMSDRLMHYLPDE